MKIALLTIWREKNFGAEMQCYATVKALKSLGHDVTVIDYRLTDTRVHTFKSRISYLISHYSPETRSFEKFWRLFIPSTRHYVDSAALITDPPEADLYLIGSDQVWNPDITRGKWHTYFLDFGDKSIRRVAFASSIGENIWKWSDLREPVSQLLRRFNYIAVREESGRKILADEFGITARTVIDPTLLHDGYPEFISPESGKNTLVYYPLTTNHELESFAMRLADITGLEYVDTNRRQYLVRSVVWNRTPLLHWLKNIAEARLVVTPSFHGLAFSLIYRRQFIIVQNAISKNRSSRITGLLQRLGLLDRYFTSINDVLGSKIWEKQIDYDIVIPRLEALRKEAWDILKEATSI